MSVELVGPKGYEYQYLVSVYVGLLLLKEENVAIYIEKQDGEDAQIRFNYEGNEYIIDIQVKRKNSDVEIEELVLWMMHFEKNSSDHNLLSKLEEDSRRYVLFITNNRCKDKASIFVDESNVYGNLNATINRELIREIRTLMRNSFKKNKGLEKKRSDYIDKFLEKKSDNELKEMLLKYRIWEKSDEDSIIYKIGRILKKEYYVADSGISNAIDELYKVVLAGRDDGNCIVERLKCILRLHMGRRIFCEDTHYVERSEKINYINELEKNNALLLTGVSLCGKTYIATDIAQYFQDKGYDVKISNELEGPNGGMEYIRGHNSEDRLLILDDPFGQVEIKETYLEVLSLIYKILGMVKVNRKIIITCRRDILLSAMHRSEVVECSICTKNWVDLTVDKDDWSYNVWKKYYGCDTKSLIVFNKIKKWIKNNEGGGFLQPGQIAQLWHEVKEIEELEGLDVTRMLEIARLDARLLAERFLMKENGFKNVVVALAIGASTISAINMENLGYLLNGKLDKPSINKEHEAVGYTIVGRSHNENIPFPQYGCKYEVDQDQKEVLRFLQQHGYIRINKLHKDILFTHPIYHHACKLVLSRIINDIFVEESIFNYPMRGISALDKNVCLNALNVVQEVWEQDKNEKLKQIAIESVYSIYPAVVDKSIIWLAKRINSLSSDEQNEFMHMATYKLKTYESDILWENGEPWFNPNKHREWGLLQRNSEANISVQMLIEKLEKNMFTSEEIWTLLNSSLYIGSTEIEVKLLIRAMSCDEAFIRSKAIYILFSQYLYSAGNIEKYLDEYEHPDVIFNLFRGALEGWFNYSKEQRKQIVEFTKMSLKSEIVAIRLQYFLENFEDEYKSECINWEKYDEKQRQELWKVWYELIIELFNIFPSNFAYMDQPHLVYVIEHSKKYINGREQIVELASAWNSWLEQYKVHHSTDDYGMSVSAYLLEGTNSNALIREELVKDMLSSKSTNLLTTHLLTFVENWNILGENEKNMIKEVLTSQRKDICWLKAVVLNAKKVPDEIQGCIIEEQLFIKGDEYIVDKLYEIELLEQCLNVYCGYPQPLWYNGYHHRNEVLWDRIIVCILKKEEFVNTKIYFIALREFIGSLLNDEEERFKNGYSIYRYILDNLNVKDSVFQQILTDTICQNQANKVLWDLFFKVCSDSEKSEYYEKISEVIEGVQRYQSGYGDLLALFEAKDIMEQIYPRMEQDNALYDKWSKVVAGVRNGKFAADEEVIKPLLEMTILVYTLCPPRLTLTNTLILKYMRELNISSGKLSCLIEENRRRLIDEGSKIGKKYDDEYILDAWYD